MIAAVEPITGRYASLEVNGKRLRLYYEEAGQGIPLLCLHTAGADGRQYRHLLNDRTVTDRFRAIAFDLPWHGKSSPPAGYQEIDYRLTPELYVTTIMAVVEALALERPVVMGCSIGGRAVLHLLLYHGSKFAAAIGLQSSLYSDDPLKDQKARTEVFNRPDVNPQLAIPALVSGLLAPSSPEAEKWETLWHYMQGGPGVFTGDVHYYKESGDLRDKLPGEIDPKVCPLYLLSGEYDYSAAPAQAAIIAKLVPGAQFQLMRNLGHFPMSENYDRFRAYLLPILDKIHDVRHGH